VKLHCGTGPCAATCFGGSDDVTVNCGPACACTGVCE
jgi:hypothetical protein